MANGNIPGNPDRSRMPHMPSVRVGGTVTAEDMGAGRSGLGDFGRAVQGAGAAQQQWAIQRSHRASEAEALTALAQYSELTGQERLELMKKSGSEAFDAPDKMKEASARHAEKIAGGFKSDYAREIFERQRMSVDSGNYNAVSAYSVQEQIRYEQTAKMADTDRVINEAVRNAGNGVILAGTIQKIKQNNAELYAGQPEEFIEQKNREMAALTAERVAQAIAVADGPAAALAFLDSGIEAEIKDGALKVKFDALRKQYETAVEFADITQMAIDAHDSLDPTVLKSSSEAMRFVWEQWPEDKTKRDQYLSMYDNYGIRKKNDANAKTIETRSGWMEQWAESGYDPVKFPLEAMGDAEYATRMMAVGANLKKALEAKMPELAVPDYGNLLNVSRLPMNERLDKIQNTYLDILTQCGGDKELFKQVQNGTLDKYLGGGSGSAGSGGGHGGSEKFDRDKAFGTNFAIMRGNPGKGMLWGQNAFDTRNPAHKAFHDNFMHYYNLRMRDAEAFPGNSPGTREEDVFYGLMRDINDGNLDVSRPTYEAFIKGQDQNGSIAVSPDSLLPQEKVVFLSGPQGKAVVTVNPDSGMEEKFKVIDAGNADLFKSISSANPVEVKQALRDGERGGVGYSIGEYHVTTNDGHTWIFTEKGERTGRVYGDSEREAGMERDARDRLRQEYLQQQARQREEDLLRDGPATPDSVKALIEKYGSDKVTQTWTGTDLLVDVPGVTYVYDKNGYRVEVRMHD